MRFRSIDHFVFLLKNIWYFQRNHQAKKYRWGVLWIKKADLLSISNSLYASRRNRVPNLIIIRKLAYKSKWIKTEVLKTDWVFMISSLRIKIHKISKTFSTLNLLIIFRAVLEKNFMKKYGFLQVPTFFWFIRFGIW